MKRLLVLGAAVLATAALAWAGAEGQPKTGGVPKPVITKAVKGERCVEDTDYMRRNHMKLLLVHRDRTVLQGIRTPQHSLKGCIDCHASEKTGSVATAKEDFCVSCHSYAAVKIDCFECHSTKPQAQVAMQTPGGHHAAHGHDADTAANAPGDEMPGLSQ